MKNKIQKLLVLSLVLVFSVSMTFAGNKQRAGSAGAQLLLVNPWASSSGWGDANVGCVRGVEGLYQNIAGTAFTKKTELVFSNTQYLLGTGISINNFGFSQKVGALGVLSASVMSMNFGEIDVTTEELPEGGLGTFKVSNTVVQLAYAQEFSNSIYGGIGVKIINEGLADAISTGVAIDAGIQYVTGIGRDKAGNRRRDNLRFGISMKNVGTTMKYTGDGFSFIGASEWGVDMTLEQRSADFELPTLIKIGGAYYINLDAKVDEEKNEVVSKHQLAIAANFTSNSFTKDQIHAGLEYNFNNILYLRGGYIYEDGISDYITSTTVYTGLTAGLTVNIPINNSGSVLAIDYSYRDTHRFNGVHTFGARVTL